MKNRTTKVALILLALVLATTCIVGSTFARYITSEKIEDDGRVGKWGVEVTTKGHLFAEQYKDTEVAMNDSSITVQYVDYAKADQNVVAPGTKCTDGIEFTIKGKPEVDVNLNIEVTAQDIVLPAGKYVDPTVGNNAIETNVSKQIPFELTEDYHPLKFYLKTTGGARLAEGTLADIEAYLEGLSRDINSNVEIGSAVPFRSDVATANNINGTYVLTWEWLYTGNDAADTYLANQAALQTVSFQIKITVTQND